MAQGWALVVGMRNQVNLDLVQVGVLGKVSPRLMLSLHAQTPSERVEVEFHDLRARLYIDEEYLGETRVAGVKVSFRGEPIQLEFPVSRRLLSHIVDRLGTSDQLTLKIGWDGVTKLYWEATEHDLRHADEVEPGKWTEVYVDEMNHKQQIMIPRSEWFSRVVRNLGTGDVVFAEIPVPTSGTQAWASTARALADAEKAYTMGDDPGVFLQLRGALDAMPGAKKEIFESLPEPQRRYVDDLTQALGAYLHAGRHVSESATGDVGFPVDHIDARFAINMFKILLSYATTVLQASALRNGSG